MPITPLEAHHVHIWSTDLAISPQQEKAYSTILSPDEIARADRLHFAEHRRRFIAARATLRELLGLYLRSSPETIAFDYGEHHKPCLKMPNTSTLQFNLAHSDEMAVFAFTLNHDIGVDIEKIKTDYNAGVASRYFSPQENVCLAALSEDEKRLAFYRLWSRKEALIKAVGAGLTLSLSSFSVSAQNIVETITVDQINWQLAPLALSPDYASAVASNQKITAIQYWTIFNHEKKFSELSYL